MSYDNGYLQSLNLPPDATEALIWLNNHAQPYPTNLPIRPLRRATTSEHSRRIVALRVGLGASMRLGGQRIRSIAWRAADSAGSFTVERAGSLCALFAEYILTSKNRGSLVIVHRGASGIFDALISQLGPHLTRLGYQLEPIIRNGHTGWLRIRKNKHLWTFSDPEVVTGESVGTIVAYARSVGVTFNGSGGRASILYAAMSAYQTFLTDTFGVALGPTISTIAFKCARHYLPEGEWVWPPSPLLVSFERHGFGYRGGLQVAQRYRGPAHRVDINRQYAGALGGSLPLRAAFGKWREKSEPSDGVYLCRVRVEGPLSYPMGVWDHHRHSFTYQRCARGDYLGVLHTAEFDALRCVGGVVTPLAGFEFTDTFTLAPYVAKLQGLLTKHGKTSPIGKLIKPLGNMVYGKFGERPEQTQLLFSLSDPGEEWAPYIDLDGHDWAQLWERQHVRHTSHQHVDIAGTITALGRAQVAQLAAWLETNGLHVVRVHTDSVTTDSDPRPYIVTSEDQIGYPRYEGSDPDHAIATANGYVFNGKAHLGGVRHVTAEQVEALQRGESVVVSDTLKRLPWRNTVAAERVEKRFTSG